MSQALPVTVSLMAPGLVFATADEGRVTTWGTDNPAFLRARAQGRVARGSSEETPWLREVLFRVSGQNWFFVFLADLVVEWDEDIDEVLWMNATPGAT